MAAEQHCPPVCASDEWSHERDMNREILVIARTLEQRRCDLDLDGKPDPLCPWAVDLLWTLESVLSYRDGQTDLSSYCGELLYLVDTKVPTVGPI